MSQGAKTLPQPNNVQGRRRKAASAAQDDLVERVVDLFIERHAKIKTRDWRNTERMLKVDVVERWGGRRPFADHQGGRP